MDDGQKYLDMLALREIKPTALRLMILKAMLGSGCAMSLLDLVDTLETVDKSTVSRTLALFLEHHLIHSIDDGSGSLKYAVCSNECSCHVDDLHTHFYCTRCHRTLCSARSAGAGRTPAGKLRARKRELRDERHLRRLRHQAPLLK